MTTRGRGWIPGFVTHPLFAATLALCWLVLQTGRKPSRITYPCQQAALRAGWVAFAIALAPAAAQLAYWLTRRGTRLAAASTIAAGLVFGGLSDTSAGQTAGRRATPLASAATATVFVVDTTGGPVGDHHRGIDRLFAGMGNAGLRFYRSAAAGLEAGPDGIVAAGDVVLIKVNQQWSERGGTNTDVLKGLIARILEHPDGFHGEVVVVENTQAMGTLDWPASNAEDHAQSVQDVVNYFAALGKPVSARLWDDIRATETVEYSAGSLQDGYVLGALDAGTGGRVSYPKFRTAGGSYVSLAKGVWNTATSSYDNTRLKFLTLPVLKCHGGAGVTGATKIHVGTMTTALATNTHNAVATGGVGSFLAEVRMPDLNILDCTYVLAIPYSGPDASYAEASHLDKLLAGRDPVALDVWAAKNVLIPAILANGYTDCREQDPEYPTGLFHTYITATAARLQAAGIPVANSLANITAIRCSASAGVPPHATGALLGPHPNPFTAATVVRFLPRVSGETHMAIYDLAGRRWRSIPLTVRTGEAQQAGWDGKGDDGRPLRPGTYYYRIPGAGEAMSGRVTLVR